MCGNQYNATVHARAVHIWDRDKITSCDRCEIVLDLDRYDEHCASAEHRALSGES